MEAITSKWHSYCLNERHAPYKFLLPVSDEAPVLAVGIKGYQLASLARSYKKIHVHKCSEVELEWANEQARVLGQNYNFKEIENLSSIRNKYFAAIIDSEFINTCDPSTAFRLLKPGGIKVLIGKRSQMPSVPELINEGFHDFQRYAILPPRNNKIVIPTEDRRLTRPGLNLITPFKWSSRFALNLGLALTFIGGQGLLGLYQLFIAKKPGFLGDDIYLQDWLRNQLCCRLKNFAMRIGWNKITIQLFDKKGNVIGIAKIADQAYGERDINNEASTLNHLQSFGELQKFIPRILLKGKWGHNIVSVQSAFPNDLIKRAPKFIPAHVEFLKIIERIDRCEMFLEDWRIWSKMWQWVHAVEYLSSDDAKLLRSVLDCCLENLSNKKLLFHRVHGDFAPWHTLLRPNRLAIIDWDDSHPDGLPYYDAVHFILGQYLLKRNKCLPLSKLLISPESIFRKALNLYTEASSLDFNRNLLRLAIILFIMLKLNSGSILNFIDEN